MSAENKIPLISFFFINNVLLFIFYETIIYYTLKLEKFL